MLAYFLYLTLLVSYFLHLTSRFPILAQIRFDLILTGLVFLFTLLGGNSSAPKLRQPNPTTRLLYMIGYILLSIPFVYWPGSVIRYGLEGLLKVIIFYFFTVLLLTTEQRLKTFTRVFLLCQLFRILEPTYLHVTQGYWGSSAHTRGLGIEFSLDRLSGAPHDVINPNQLGWLIITTSIYLYFLYWVKRSIVPRLCALALVLVCLYALLLTGSRSSLLTVFVTIAIAVHLRYRRASRLLVAAALVLLVTAVVANHLTPELTDRYLSLYDRSRPGGSTAQGRIDSLYSGFANILSNPIFGHGVGTSPELSGYLRDAKPQPTHNLYLETLEEVGIVGLILFLLYIREVIRAIRTAAIHCRSSDRRNSFLANVITATHTWILMHLFYSIAIFGLNSWEWYFFGGLSTACLALAARAGSTTAAPPQLVPAVGQTR